MQLIVYTPVDTPRLRYICSVLLPAMGIKKYYITADVKEYCDSHAQAAINYSNNRLLEHECHIVPVSLLFESVIMVQPINVYYEQSVPAFFKTPGSDMPFDFLAASFYLITRYEEYLSHKKDLYGRYAHQNSLAFQHGFLQVPLVNIWLQQFLIVFKGRFPAFELRLPPFAFTPTYDIDIAWSFLNKGLIRNTGATIKSLLKGKFRDALFRLRVLISNAHDPFDCYNWLQQLHDRYQLYPVYFFLVASKSKGYDKNISPRNKNFQSLVQQHSQMYPVGVHPSWQSGDHAELLACEAATLKHLTGKEIVSSRQHYIRFALPHTYRQLLAAGITNDYSMGYGTINGFRASFCLPYAWYNLANEEITSLTVHPFCFMDANAFFEEKLTAQQALNELVHYYNTTRKYNGHLVTIWHNHLLGTDKIFLGWRQVYEAFLQYVAEKDRLGNIDFAVNCSKQ